jgi:hypothetical protein
VSNQPLVRQIDALAIVLDHSANDLSAAAVALQNGQRGIVILFGDENARADPHIVDLVHFR